MLLIKVSVPAAGFTVSICGLSVAGLVHTMVISVFDGIVTPVPVVTVNASAKAEAPPARFESVRVITRSVLELPRLALARVKVFPATNLLLPTAVTVTEVIELVPATTVSVQPVQPEDGVMSG
jgi:hypothetical protein